MNATELARHASHPRVPVAERVAARAELEAQYRPTRTDLPDSSGVRMLVDHLLYSYEHADLQKARQPASWHGGVRPMPEQLDRAPGEGMALLVDERGNFNTGPGGYRMRPAQFGPAHMRLMVEQTPLINSIILRRCRTIGRFLRTSERNRDLGFEVRRNDEANTVRPRRGPEETALEQFLLHSGWERNPIKMRSLHRDMLTAFMGKSVRDILTLDAWAIETVPTRNGKLLDGYYVVDAETIYLASEQGYMGDDSVTAVQIVNGMPVTAFRADEMVYTCMNPRSEVRYYGYGYAPPEMVVKVVTGYLNALTYNLRGFDSNAIPRGLLTLFGDYDQNQLRFFKQQWNAMVRGVNNAWSLPVMVSDTKEAAAQYTKFDQEFTDMYFAKWMVLLTSIICSVYGMDPTEIYAESFHAGRSSLSGSDTAEKLADARDTGLEPVMTFLENVITDDIIARISPDYVFRFYGIRPLDQEWVREADKLSLTVNEFREKQGYEKLPEPWGEAPLNPSLLSAWTQARQSGMNEAPEAGAEVEAENPEPTVADAGERAGADPPAAVATTDRGEREPGEADQMVMPGRPAPADRDRSTMLRKARMPRLDDVVIVG